MVVTNLDFSYDGMDKPVLKNFQLNLPAGSRWAMVIPGSGYFFFFFFIARACSVFVFFLFFFTSGV